MMASLFELEKWVINALLQACPVHCEPRNLLVLRNFGVACGARESFSLVLSGIWKSGRERDSV